MMLTVHGLPIKTKFQDVKDLIKQECNIPDFIMDNLVDDGFNAKKVRIGLTNESDGYRLMKCLEGFRMSGSHVLKVIPVGKPSQPPLQNFDTRSNYPNQRNDYPNQPQSDYASHDYSRLNTNPSSHAAHGRNPVLQDRHHGSHETRGLVDARQSLSQTMADTRHQDRYQNQPRTEIGQGDQDYRDPSRGPLVPPALRPASMDAQASFDRTRPGLIDTGSAGMRNQESYRPMERQVNPEPTNQQQWNTTGNDWSTPRVIPNQNTGYNYQQPQGAGYGQQPSLVPQGGYPQNRAPQTQNYQQPNITAQPPARAHVLRSVQLVDAPITPRVPPAFPPAQKPVTIMKDNFQGPTQYNVSGQPQSQGAYQSQGQGQTTQPWQQGQTKQLAYDKSYDERRLAMDKRPDKHDYDKRRYSPTRNMRNSPGRSPTRKPINAARTQNYPERRVSPSRTYPERRDDPTRHITSSTDFTTSGRRISPSKMSLKDRRISPTRKLSPRRGSPLRRVSPGRRNSPSNRRISPFRKISPGRRMSPRKPSPIGRRVTPSKHISPRHSPARRISPFRKVTPVRRVSPGKRNSPSRRTDLRRMSPSMTNYDYYVEDERRMGGRLLSPRRYSPKRSPPRSSGRYSPSEHKYEADGPNSKGTKPIRPAYEPSQAQKYTGASFRANESQYPATARIEPKIPSWQNEKITYPAKKEDRDVSRRTDPEKKPSPRSRSRSPVKDRFRRHSPSPRSPRRSWALEKRRSPDAIREPPPPPLWPGQDTEDKPKHPVWEVSDSEEDRFKTRRNEGTYSPRFSPRREDRHEYRDESKFDRDYREDREDRTEYRRDSPHRNEKKLFNEVDKDFNDIYQRAVEFRRKTEELRKSNDRRNRSYDEGDEDSTWRDAPERTERVDKPKPVWIPIKIQTKDVERNKCRLEPAVKEKRDKAVEEIANQILEPHNFTGEQRIRVMDELKLSIYNIMLEMFKDKDVSYIELVIKFRARYDSKDEEKILLDVLSSMPSHYRNQMKRKGEGTTENPLKVARRSPAYGREVPTRPKLADAVNKKYTSHSHSSKLTSRHEPRKNTDSRATKRSSGRRNSSRNRSSERNAKEPRLSPYINEDKTQSAAVESAPPKDTKKDTAAKPARYTELSPLMTKMVEDELKNIMINVWQSLPATANNTAEKMVLEKLKDTAGDDLRNTIGLNITNRLINIHNGILVKIIIYSAVTPSDIYSFSKKFNIQELKNVRSRTYAGRLLTWADLDALVTKKDLKCGKSRVSVTPIYNFLKCPPSVRTVFDGSQDYSEAKAKEKELAKTMKKLEVKPVLTADKVLAEDAKTNIARNDSSKADAKDITSDTKSSEKAFEYKKSNDKTSDPKTSKENVSDSKSNKEVLVTKNSGGTVTKNKSLKIVPGTNNSELVSKKVENKSEPSKTESKSGVTKNIVPVQNVEKPADNKPINKKSEPAVAKKAITTPKSTNIQAKLDSPNIVKKQTQNAVIKEAKTEMQPTKVEPTKTIATKQAVATNLSKVTDDIKVVTPAKVDTPKVATTPKKDDDAQKSNEKKPDVKTTKVEPNKAPIRELTKPPTKPVTPNSAKKETVPKPSEVNKPEIKAAQVEPKLTAKVINKPNNTPKKEGKSNPAEIKIPNTKVMKVLPKSAKSAKIYKVDTKSKRNESDFDELSDHDILAMLSGGIVLDECSGSEED